jgi:hypothetical protein
VVADEVILLSSGGGPGRAEPGEEMADAPSRPVSMPRSAQPPRQAPPATPPAAAPPDDFAPGVTDDDIPF